MTEGISGVGGGGDQFRKVIEDLGQTTAIAQEIFQAVNELKDQIDLEMRRDQVKEVMERLTTLQRMLERLGQGAPQGMVAMVDQIEGIVDQLGFSASSPDSESARQVAAIREQLEALRDQLSA